MQVGLVHTCATSVKGEGSLKNSANKSSKSPTDMENIPTTQSKGQEKTLSILRKGINMAEIKRLNCAIMANKTKTCIN